MKKLVALKTERSEQPLSNRGLKAISELTKLQRQSKKKPAQAQKALFKWMFKTPYTSIAALELSNQCKTALKASDSLTRQLVRQVLTTQNTLTIGRQKAVFSNTECQLAFDTLSHSYRPKERRNRTQKRTHPHDMVESRRKKHELATTLNSYKSRLIHHEKDFNRLQRDIASQKMIFPKRIQVILDRISTLRADYARTKESLPTQSQKRIKIGNILKFLRRIESILKIQIKAITRPDSHRSDNVEQVCSKVAPRYFQQPSGIANITI